MLILYLVIKNFEKEKCKGKIENNNNRKEEQRKIKEKSGFCFTNLKI